ncbi:MAG: hypothetical protein LBC03_06645 [Nitrososphaerota archaeon]|jgi:hypothetical protein|nr:hypothetical protein [Nitrososphaerota archaeon]
MQLPPLIFSDLAILLAVGTIALLITIELSSPYYGQTNLSLNRTKLKNAAYTTGVLFLITAIMIIVQILVE